MPFLLLWLGSAYLATGQSEQGLQTIDVGLELTKRTGARMLDAEMLRLRGDLLLLDDQSATAAARQCFRQAIDVARKQSAKSWELRATTSLARLLKEQGDRDEPLSMLSEIYDWFSEGFATADLKDAKALLDELSS